VRLRLKQQRLIELLTASPLSQNHWALKVGVMAIAASLLPGARAARVEP
jgi:hypothetical protein